MDLWVDNLDVCEALTSVGTVKSCSGGVVGSRRKRRQGVETALWEFVFKRIRSVGQDLKMDVGRELLQRTVGALSWRR